MNLQDGYGVGWGGVVDRAICKKSSIVLPRVEIKGATRIRAPTLPRWDRITHHSIADSIAPARESDMQIGKEPAGTEYSANGTIPIEHSKLYAEEWHQRRGFVRVLACCLPKDACNSVPS